MDAYLGTAGAMVALPTLEPGLSTGPARGEQVHEMVSGGIATTRVGAGVKRTYAADFTYLDADDADLLLDFYAGLYGDGPYTLIDPTVRNVLPLDDSVFGKRFSRLGAWGITSGTLAVDSTLAAPSDTPQSGVATWTTAPNNGRMFPGTFSSSTYIPAVGSASEVASAAPWLAGQPVTVSMWARTASSTCSASLDVLGTVEAGSTTPVVKAGTSTSLTTTWTRLTTTLAANTSGWSNTLTPYVFPALTCKQATAPSLYVAAAQLEYASAMSDWQSGKGCPRVLFLASPGRVIPVLGTSNHTLTLGEV